MLYHCSKLSLSTVANFEWKSTMSLDFSLTFVNLMASFRRRFTQIFVSCGIPHRKINVTIFCCFQVDRSLAGSDHRDHSIHIERACQLHGAIMTQHGLLHKGFHISWLSWAHWYKQTIFCLDKWPNLGYADVKLNIACMHPLACLHTLSLCVYCDLY